MSDHSDHEVATRLATEAGRLLLKVRDELADAIQAERKAVGDKRSHDYLMEALARERPTDAVLSEEGADNPVRLRSARVWIVDPLISSCRKSRTSSPRVTERAVALLKSQLKPWCRPLCWNTS